MKYPVTMFISVQVDLVVMSIWRVLLYCLLIAVCGAGGSVVVADTDAWSPDTSQVGSTSLSSSHSPTLLVQRPYGYVLTTCYNDANLSLHASTLDRSGNDGAVIRGTVQNGNPEEIGIAIIAFNLFDASGNQIGNAYASIDFLAPRTNWRFVTDPILHPDVQFYRFAHFFTSSDGPGS